MFYGSISTHVLAVLVHMFIVSQCFIGQTPLYVKDILEIEIWLVIMFFELSKCSFMYNI